MGLKACLAVVFGRFVVLPILGCVLVVGTIKLGWYEPPNPVFVFLLLLQVRRVGECRAQWDGGRRVGVCGQLQQQARWLAGMAGCWILVTQLLDTGLYSILPPTTPPIN